MDVSAIIPVYNGESLVGDALNSIFAQTRLPGEVIVVDDGSTDSTAGVVQSYGDRVHYVFQDNRGPSAALNRGLELARGEMIAMLDADDAWTPDKLERQAGLLDKDPSVDMVAGMTRWFRTNPQTEAVETFPEDRAMLCLSCATMRKSVFDKVGAMASDLPLYGFDTDWFFRAKEAGANLVLHEEVTLLYRRHRANVTNNQGLDRRFFLNSIKRSLERRRRADHSVTPLSAWLDADEKPIQLRPS